jgi:hypothetical protein
MDDSASLYYAAFPTQVFAQEVHVTDRSIPRNVKEALSPAFVDEWGAAIDRENAGFIKHSCFELVTFKLPKTAKVLAFGHLLVNGIILLKLGFVLEGIVSFWAEIILPTRITVLSCPVVTIVFYWHLVLTRGGQFIKLMWFKHFFMVSWMMRTFTSNLQPGFLRLHVGLCSNFSKLFMVFIKLQSSLSRRW